MLSKKRALLFDVLGQKSRQARGGSRAQEPETDGVREFVREPVRGTFREIVSEVVREPRIRRVKPRKRTRAPVGAALAKLPAPVVRWAALAGILIVVLGFAIWRLRRPETPQLPSLQTNVGESSSAADPGGPIAEPKDVFSVCAFERRYQNKTDRDPDRERAALRVQELVDFLGYHPDPVFRDARGKDHPGKEPGSGTFRIYVGSATTRTDLVRLKDKVAGLAWKGMRPFQDAYVRKISR